MRGELIHGWLRLQRARRGKPQPLESVASVGSRSSAKRKRPTAKPQVTDKATVALREFNAAVLSDERVTLSIVPVGDGMALCRKR